MKIRMHEKCMKRDMQKEKHYGLSPIQSYQRTSFQHIKHISKMHESLLKCNCDAIHDVLNSFKQKPTQKFCEKLINFEKPQFFKKKKNPKS